MIALFAIVALTGLASAASEISISQVNINGIDMLGSYDNIAAFAGQTIPVKVTFTSTSDTPDELIEGVRVEIELEGYRESIDAETDRFSIVPGNLYTRTLWITVPLDVDEHDESALEDFNLYVEVTSKDATGDVEEFTLNLQRDDYKLDVLSVESASSVTAGDTLQLDVVIKNKGIYKISDAFVTASIPELGISKKVYFTDLVPYDTDSGNDNSNSDSVEGRIYLSVPSSASAGTYTLKVKADSRDAEDIVEKSITVLGASSGSDVLATVSSQTVKPGETGAYQLMLVNPTDNIKVYTLVVETASGISANVEGNPMISIPAGSSAIVNVNANAQSEGTYTFNVAVYSGSDLVKRVPLTAVVDKDAKSGTGSSFSADPMTVLAIVLTIVFVVLLIVLIVLLTRSPAKSEEEFGESYY